jgi:hypothetical protein
VLAEVGAAAILSPALLALVRTERGAALRFASSERRLRTGVRGPERTARGHPRNYVTASNFGPQLCGGGVSLRPPKLPVQKTPGMLRLGAAALAGAGLALAAVRFGDRLQRQNSGGARRSAANERSCAAKAGSPGEQAEAASDWGSPVHPPERDGNKTMSPSRLPRPRQLFSDRDQSRNEVQLPTHARRCRNTALPQRAAHLVGRALRQRRVACAGHVSLLPKHARGMRADGVRARGL